jgi:tetratricopeptide (TPR) repeat protein
MLTTILCLATGLACAGAAEPAIAEMLDKARTMAEKDKPAPPENASEQVPDSDFVKAMKLRLQYEVNQRFEKLQRDNYALGNLYFDLLKFTAAIEAYNKVLQRDADNFHARVNMAKALLIFDKPELCAQHLDEVSKRAVEPWMVGEADRLKKWVAAFPEKLEEAKKLKAKAAADAKDAEGRWRLLDMYRYDYPMMLDQFIGLLQFRELYAQDRRVTGGECEWRLMEVFWHFGIRDETMKLAEKFRESYPKHWATTGGEATWRLGDWCEQEKRYPDALKCYNEMVDKFPKHWVNGPRPNNVPYIQERIAAVNKALKR